MIELEKVNTYPLKLTEYFDKVYNLYYSNDKKIKRYDSDFREQCSKILKDYKFIAYHFTKIIDENNYYENGILNYSSDKLLEIQSQNLNLSKEFLKEILFKGNEDEQQYIHFTYNLENVLNENCLGTLVTHYGGELLCNCNATNDKVIPLESIGKPAYIKFWIYFDSSDISLCDVMADCYYDFKNNKDDFNGHDGMTKKMIKPEQIIDIVYI